jgi:hypothetical protein
VLAPVVHVVFGLGMLALTIAWCRWTARTSRLLAVIVIAGLTLRVALGAALFLISHFHVGILTGWQAGSGFWTLAPDASFYYRLAADAAASHTFLIPAAQPSPTYLTALALWLWAAGISVPSAVAFNVGCYLATTAALVAGASRKDGGAIGTWRIAVVAFFSFSPMLLFTSTQVLKEPFFVLLVVVTCRAAYELFDACTRVQRPKASTLAALIGLCAAGLALISGVRAYFGVFLSLAFAAGLVTLVWRGAPTFRRSTLALLAGCGLVVFWMAFETGFDPHYQYVRDAIVRTGAAGVDNVRTSFEQGATVLSSPVAGLLATFVPMSVLKGASLVTFDGGRGLMGFADLDTIFLDATFLLVAVFVVKRRSLLRANLPSVLFTFVLVAVSTLLVAYVVANFGTLVRIRLVIAAPAWLTPLALGARRQAGGAES